MARWPGGGQWMLGRLVVAKLFRIGAQAGGLEGGDWRDLRKPQDSSLKPGPPGQGGFYTPSSKE